MEEQYIKRNTTLLFLAVLLVLSFLLLKPILLSIVIGVILAFIFNPLYKRTVSIVKYKSLAAFLICIILILLILIPFWFLTPILIKQSFIVFQASQQIDFITPLKNFFPGILSSEQISSEVGSAISSFITKATNYFMNSLSELLLNFPTIALQLLVVFFTLFYTLREQDEVLEYVKDLLPFSKDVEKKLFDYSKGITIAVIYGQIIIGVIQGFIAGLGFFIFKVPNALLLTLFATLGAMLPIVGPVVVWVPVVIYLWIAGNNTAAIGVLCFGLIASTVDNILRPVIVSQKTKIPPSIVLVGMVGGLFLFGILGFILGPLILAYLLIILELYRGKKLPGVLIQEEKKN